MKKIFSLFVLIFAAQRARAQQLVSFTNAPLITASSAYSSGQSLGGVFTLGAGSGAVRTDNGRSWLESIRIRDIDGQAPALNLLIFASDPVAAGWTLTDHAAAVPSASTTSAPISISILSTDWLAVGTDGILTISNLHMPVESASGATRLVYCAFVSVGTPTYSTTNSVRLKAFFNY